MELHDIRDELAALASPEKARVLQGFFKTGPGDYGEGDVFLGITVPQLRSVAKDINTSTSRRALLHLLQSRYHEERLLGLLVLVHRFQRGSDTVRADIYQTYCEHIAYVNNWDLVDLTAPCIVGPHLQDAPRDPLDRWAVSGNLWERRIAIVSTFHFIRQQDFADTLRIADTLLNDDHDLIHKAVGWMLREVGKRDRTALEAFLKPRYSDMPRTMLRYAIERLPEPLRQTYLRGTLIP